ncbi:MAG: hypothetical protein HOA17_01475 [Candidatus Melainabacteria bacterium]|nr:hypothetical protein [Candidatus Melainabacteria bacterium]
MIKIRSSLIALVLLCIGTASFAVTSKIEALVDTRTIKLNEVVTLTVAIYNLDPEFVHFAQDTADYTVTATSSSKSFRLVNGKSDKSITYKYVIKPKHPGIITIPSVKVKSGPLTYDTDPVAITVNTVSPVNSVPVKQATSLPHNSAATKKPVAKKKEQDIFAKFELNNDKPYTNEQMNLKLKIYHKGNLRTLNLQPLQLDNFIVERDNKAKEYQEVFNRSEYYIYEIDFILYPAKAGTSIIPATAIDTVILEDRDMRQVDPFKFMNPFLVEKKRQLLTQAITVEVQNFPPGAPKDFTGYVGELAVIHSLKEATVKSGDAISLETQINGDGNSAALSPEMVYESKQYSIFGDKENLVAEIVNNRKYFEATRTTAIIANKDKGKLSIKTKPLISFNPKTKKYETHSKNKFEVDVIANPNALKATDTVLENQDLIKPKTIKPSKTLFTVPVSEILNHKKQPVKNRDLVLLIIFINLIAFCFKAYKYLKGFADPIKNLASNGQSISSYIKKTKNAEKVSDISIILKEFAAKVKANKQAEVGTKLNDFFEESDKANYSVQTNNGSGEQLEYFRTKAINLIKELANAR